MSVQDMVRGRWGTGQRVGETDPKGQWNFADDSLTYDYFG